MENTVIDAVSLGGSVADVDFSVWGLFLRADIVVKVVIIGLLIASIWCWAIIFEKMLGLRRLNARANEFETAFWSGGSLDTLYDNIGSYPRDPMSAVFVAAMKEWRRALARGGNGVRTGRVKLGERIDRVMQIAVMREMDRAERYMTFLASTGATAPFIGLFGTIWGIMDAFISIGQTGSTSLAVIAPGISEALVTTAIGLVAAIPAVVAYNHFVNKVNLLTGEMDSFSQEFLNIVQRMPRRN